MRFHIAKAPFTSGRYSSQLYKDLIEYAISEIISFSHQDSPPSTQNFFAPWGADFRSEEYPTRSKPLIVLALLVLSLAATALAQTSSDENGTDRVGTAASAMTNWLEQKETIIGTVVGLLTIIGYISGFFSHVKKIILVRFGRDSNENASPASTTSGERGVAIGGDVSGSIIITGDSNLITEGLESLSKTYYPPDPPQIDEIPPRGDLPPGSHVPFSPNKVFTGREEDLLKLARTLLSSDSKGVTITQTAAVATGLGGVGKTQLAVEFCYRYGRFFYGVHWIQADLDISAEVAACGAAMNLPKWPDKVPEQVALTLRTWKEGGPRLVVLDNVEDPATVQEWLPKMPLARLILTSRRSEWPNDMGLLIRPLGVLTLTESLTLLRKLAPRLKDVADSDLENLADRFGCLPLALDLVGRYLHDRTDLSVEDYLVELEEAGNSLEHTSLKDWTDHNPTKHATNLAATFALSWDQLGEGEDDALARRIFLTCGYCAPNTPIPKSLLEKATGADGTSQKQKQDLALRRLSRLGLLTPTENGPSLHPLLSEFAKYLNVEGQVLSSLADALSSLSYEVSETSLPERMVPLQEHLKSVAKVAEIAELNTSGSLWNNLGCHLREVAEYKNAEEAHRRGLVIDEKVYGTDHPNVATDANNLGGVLQYLGDLDGAKRYFERALKISEKVYGLDHPQVAIFVNNLGTVLRKLGDLDGAKKSFKRAIKIDEKVYGPDHPSVATDVNNLGLALKDLGDLKGAKKSFERALKIGENVYGLDHPQVAIFVNNLGAVLQDLGDLDGAKKSFERALEIDEKVYGTDHPNSARDVNNLGTVLRYLGDLDGAKRYFERALEIDENVYGPDHPTVATDVNNLGLVLKDLGDLDGAKEHYERALKICQEQLGEDHPNTKLVRKNLESLRQ